MDIRHKIKLKNSIARKLISFFLRYPRALKRCSANQDSYRNSPPIVVNSFPKSGTHLLTQILESFPGIRNYGTFIASLPSLSYRERGDRRILSKLNKIVPGEMVSAHLFYKSSFRSAISDKNIVHYFIFRDPRDVYASVITRDIQNKRKITSTSAISFQWLKSYRTFRQYRKIISPEKYQTIR